MATANPPSDPDPLKHEKAELRRELRRRLLLRDPVAAARDSAALVLALADCLPPGPVLAYVPLAGEPALRPLLEELARAGRLLLPRVSADGLRIHPISRLESLVSGRMGLWEPPPDWPEGALGDLAAVVVPGLGFSLEGGRLGRGGGYYDRLLAALPTSTRRIAALFPEQLVEQLPEEAHDRRVELLLLPDRRIRVVPPGGR